MSALLVVCISALAADNSWNNKPYDQWTREDVMAILRSSPWAKTNIEPTVAGQPTGTTAITDPSVLSPIGTEEWGQPAQFPDYVSEAALDFSAKTYDVLWLSSRTIREAFARHAILSGKMTQDKAAKLLAQPEDSYQILVAGPNVRILQKRSENEVRGLAFLQIRGDKAKLHPNHVAIWKNGLGATTCVVFYFPKATANGAPTLDSTAKELDFYLSIEHQMVLTNFDIQKMVDSRGLDL